MASIAKKIAVRHHDERSTFTTKHFSAGRHYRMPHARQKEKRLARHLADVKEARMAWKEAKDKLDEWDELDE